MNDGVVNLDSSDVLSGELGQRHFHLTVDGSFCNSHGALFGGWAMGLSSEAARIATGQPVRWMTTNFMTPVSRGTKLELRVTSFPRSSRLAHCRIDGLVGDVLAFTSLAMTSHLPGNFLRDPNPPETGNVTKRRSWLVSPAAPLPENCPPRTYRSVAPRSVADTMDVRVVATGDERDSAGSGLLWARLRLNVPDASALVVLSDHIPYLAHRVLPSLQMALTVSASVSLTGSAMTPWALIQLQLVATDGAYCIGRVTSYNEYGLVLGTADQMMRTKFSP